ncbi:hypothetical protein GCM10023116_16060 [Kistimonas scapharcae]|uniref:Uncharacterized protein n=1 Tax=Kistimonas scapharcae TaxID=1036133 RepID=A0ABP8V0D0_9GAMM
MDSKSTAKISTGAGESLSLNSATVSTQTEDDLSAEELSAWRKHCSGDVMTQDETMLLYRVEGVPSQFASCEWDK